MFAIALFACHPEPKERVPVEPPAPSGPVWADVAPLLDRCAGCHDHSGLVSPITSWEEAAALAPLIRAAVSSRSMPPWPAGPADVAYRDDPSLTDDEIASIVAWIDGGAQRGDEERPLQAPPEVALPRVDFTLAYPEPYAPVGNPDDIRCFVLDSRALGDVWVTGARVVPGNLEAAHHILLMAIVPSSVTDNPLVAAWSDPGPGFDCNDESNSSSFPGTYAGLGGWLPGRSALILPEGAGIHVEDNALLLVEAHYYTPSGSSDPDDSRFELMVEPEVDRPAAELRLTDPEWQSGIAVAAGETATHSVEMAAREAPGLSLLDREEGLLVHSIIPHMHTHGQSIRVTLAHSDGESLVLVDIPAWDFDWQLQYWLQQPLLLSPDDVLSLSCTYRNDSDVDVLFGAGTGDEMCVARLLVTEP